MSEINQEYLDYKTFYTEHENKNLTQIANEMEKINEKCLNKSFIYILLWQKWVDEPGTVTYFLQTESGDNVKISESESGKTTFNNFKLIPYTERGVDILPVIDVRSIFKCINFGENITVLNSIYEKIFSILNDKKEKKRIDLYIDQKWTNMEKSLTGFYIDLLSVLNQTYKDYLFNLNGNNVIIFPEIMKERFTFKDKENVITDKINYIKTITHPIQEQIEEYDALENINFAFNRIIKVIQTIINYSTLLSQYYDDEKAERVNISNLLNLKSESNVPLDRLIEIIKPTLQPIFKKSYVVRENNLFGYAKVKLIKNVNKSKNKEENGNFIEIDNFDIPYNNITNFEYNVAEQKAILSLIDAEGSVSELLINKMYSFFNSNSEYVKNQEQNTESAEYFQIEYGWSGPITEDDEEMIENGIYTKKTFNGHIKSITSQFTQKGTEYSIDIMPNNFKIVNNNPMDAHAILYAQNKDKASFLITMIIIFLILNNIKKDDFFKEFNKTNASFSSQSTTNIFLETIFIFLLEKNDNFYIQEKTVKGVKSYQIIVINATNIPVEIEIDKQNNIDDFNLVELLIQNIKFPKEEKSIKKYKINELSIGDLDNVRSIIEKEKYSLNGWLVSIFIIITIKNFFKDKNDFFLLHDITGLFDIIRVNARAGSVLSAQYINTVSLFDIIKKFNPFCLDEQTLKNININENNSNIGESNKTFFDMIKNSMEKKSNKYALINLVPYVIDDSDILKFQNISFFIKKLKEIFNSIQLLGLNTKTKSKDIFSISDSIVVNYMVHEKESEDQVKKKYKEIIYSNKDIIYTIKDKGNKKIEEFSYDEFSSNYDLTKIDGKNYKKFTVMFLSYSLSLNKLFNNQSFSLSYKLGFLTKNIAQSYSLMPRIRPKTRNSNKQFFSQGNDKMLRESSGDILDFEIEKLDIQKTVGLIINNKNQKNIGFNDFSSNTFVDGMYENAAKYYNTYIDINGTPDKLKIVRDMATLQSNYKNAVQLKGSITIFGEPYWSDINLLKSKYIHITINYNNGRLSSHSGLYMVTNAIHTISDGKYVTKLEIIRQYTFLSNFSVKGDVNTFLM